MSLFVRGGYSRILESWIAHKRDTGFFMLLIECFQYILEGSSARYAASRLLFVSAGE